MGVSSDPTCEGCGACCAPGVWGQGLAPYLVVTEHDMAAGFQHRTPLVRRDGQFLLPVVRAHNDYTQCEHLEGRVLEDARCAVYEQRPQACRTFEPESEGCRALRTLWVLQRFRLERHTASSARNVDRAHAVVAVNLVDRESLGEEAYLVCAEEQ